jgi:choice-of-anchor B domain-containing protein
MRHVLIVLQMDLYNFKSHADLGSFTGQGSGSWGWVSDDGREFVAIGQADGAAFIEILPDGAISYLGRLPQYSELQRGSAWREIKMYKNYAIIGSEAYDHGIQIFDMTKLLDLDPANPTNFSLSDQTAHFDNREYMPWGRSHNVIVNEELGYAAAIGSAPRVTLEPNACASGYVWINLTDPANPTSPGCK